jgi:hypothetical protein
MSVLAINTYGNTRQRFSEMLARRSRSSRRLLLLLEQPFVYAVSLNHEPRLSYFNTSKLSGLSSRPGKVGSCELQPHRITIIPSSRK